MSAKAAPKAGALRKFVNNAQPWLPWKIVPKASQEKCSNCTKVAETYCVNCKKTLCRFCTCLLHHPDTKFEKHSIEEIIASNAGGVKIITPILLDLFLMALVFFFLSGSGINEEYFRGGSYCPGLFRFRSWLARFDANIFFYYKEPLAQYCDWEDSYWRFFMDTWVRGILTGTDGWLLLIVSFFRAVLLEEFLRIILTPIIANTYAVVAYFVRSFEVYLHQFVYNRLEGSEHQATAALQRLEKVVDRLSFCAKMGLADGIKPPPPTLRRRRPASDWAEMISYMLERRLRLISYYQAQAQTACRAVLRMSVLICLATRLLCLLFGNTPFLVVSKLLGLRSLAARHQELFTASTGIEANQQQAYWTDLAAGWMVQQGLNTLPLVSSRVEEVAFGLRDNVFDAFVLFLQKFWFVIPLLLSPILYRKLIAKQQQQFADDWNSKHKKEIWGDMSRENPCGGTAWKQLNFSRSPPLVVTGDRPLLRRASTTVA